jgi:lysophospholipase L1-like esterase
MSYQKNETHLYRLLTLSALLSCAALGVEQEKSAPPDPCVPAQKFTVWSGGGSWQSSHSNYVARAKRGGVNLVFFGDSITQWWPWTDFKARYEPLGAVNFGIGGDRVENLLWRVENGEMEGITPKVAVILIGTNNDFHRKDIPVAKGIAKVVEAIRRRSPTTKVLVLGIFPRGWDKGQFDFYVPHVKRVNAELALLDNGDTVRFADVGKTLPEPDGSWPRSVSSDGLHLAPEGYRRWAMALKPLLAEMMGLPESAFPEPVPEQKPKEPSKN